MHKDIAVFYRLGLFTYITLLAVSVTLTVSCLKDEMCDISEDELLRANEGYVQMKT